MQDLKSTLEQEIASEKIIVFAKSFCPHSKEAKAFLVQGDIEFKMHDMDLMDNGEQV